MDGTGQGAQAEGIDYLAGYYEAAGREVTQLLDSDLDPAERLIALNASVAFVSSTRARNACSATGSTSTCLDTTSTSTHRSATRMHVRLIRVG